MVLLEILLRFHTVKSTFWMPKCEAFAQKKLSKLPCSTTTTLANHRKPLPSTRKIPDSTESTSLWWHFVEKLARIDSNDFFIVNLAAAVQGSTATASIQFPFCCARCTRLVSGFYPTSPACAIRSPICFGIRPASNSVQTFLYWKQFVKEINWPISALLDNINSSKEKFQAAAQNKFCTRAEATLIATTVV